LLNDPSWQRYIGKRVVRSLPAARAYIAGGPTAMYAQRGLGLHVAELASTRRPIGLCGLIKRATLDDIDLGFAFLPAFRGRGYAQEASAAVLEYARRVLGLSRNDAIATPDNAPSIAQLDKLGHRFERTVRLARDAALLNVYAWSEPAAS
jgi:RimJ/RimL family protein N-acetyltransferase